MFTQNKVLSKVILKLIAVNLMIYFNSIKLREASITLTSFVQKRENYPDFLCMNAMHTSGFSLFLSSNGGILHSIYFFRVTDAQQRYRVIVSKSAPHNQILP